MKQLIIIAGLLFGLSFVAQAQTKTQKSSGIDTLVVEASVQCGMCVKRITNCLKAEKAVVNVLHSKQNMTQFVVIYNTKKADESKILQAISDIGYDANAVAANEKAYSKLPDCCQKPK